MTDYKVVIKSLRCVEHDNGYIQHFAVIESTCPTCQRLWEREVYWDYMHLNALSICDGCCSEDKITIVGNNKAWP